MGSPSSLLATDRPFEDDDWQLLIDDIKQQKVVPVVGRAVLTHGADAATTLQQHLATELIRKLRLDVSRLGSQPSLLEVCSLTKDRQKMCEAIRKIMEAANWPMPDPLAQ